MKLSQDTTRCSKDSGATSVMTESTMEGTTFSEKLRRPLNRRRKIIVPLQKSLSKEILVPFIKGPLKRNASFSVKKTLDQAPVEVNGSGSGSSSVDNDLLTEVRTPANPRSSSIEKVLGDVVEIFEESKPTSGFTL